MIASLDSIATLIISVRQNSSLLLFHSKYHNQEYHITDGYITVDQVDLAMIKFK